MRPIPCPCCHTHLHQTPVDGVSTRLGSTHLVCGVCGWAMTQWDDIHTTDAALERHRHRSRGQQEQMKDPMEG